MSTRRKRNIDEVTNTDPPRQSRPPTAVKTFTDSSAMPPPPSPSNLYGRPRAVPTNVHGYRGQLSGDDMLADSTTSYTLTGSVPSPHMSQSWSTPRSMGVALPIDLTALSPAAPNPFSISFGTPSTANVPLDSAYLPTFAYSMNGEDGLPAPSPSQFDLSDLPYSGMDFLHTLGGSFQDSSTSEQNEALWAQLGTSPFKAAPELPFGTI